MDDLTEQPKSSTTERQADLIDAVRRQIDDYRRDAGTATYAPPHEPPPERIGPYRILERLGSGGMGEVYLAEQTEPVRRRVALKLIKLGMDTRQVVARFESERQALALMNHPNIAAVLDAGAGPTGRPYFVMEHVPGEPITAYCDRHKLPVRERLELFIQVCNAVQHAHQKAIIHRDIKPSNVLVMVQDGKPVPKVIDFGVAKATNQKLTEQTVFTEQGQIIGTPEYMSPEQAEMTALDIDTRTDIYSLGVLLYELLTGTLPFDPRTLRSRGYAEIQRMIREVEPPKPSTRLSAMQSERPSEPPTSQIRRGGPSGGPRPERAPRPNIQPVAGARHGGSATSGADSSAAHIANRRQTDARTLIRHVRGDLDWIVMKCLEKDRTRRYDTANGLALEIGRYLRSEPVLAGPPSAAYRVRKFVRRNSGPVVAVAAILALLLGATSVSTVLYLRAEEQRRLADIARVGERQQRQDAEIARARAEKAEEEAKARADELEQVAEFQEQQLSDIDAQNMGVRLCADLLTKARAAVERSGRPPEEVEARITELEVLIAGSDFTGMALNALNENVFQRALTAIDKQFGDQPLVKAQLLQTLAEALRSLGLLDGATVPQTEALAIRRRVLGNEHPDTLGSIHNMGSLLQAQGKLDEAEPYKRDALEKYRRVLGDEHPDTLASINNIGFLLQLQGKLAEAEGYYREALETRRRVLGEEHPQTLVSVGNMGSLLKAQGKLAEAEGYCREALEKRRRVLGEEHPETLVAIKSMGTLLKAQGKLAEAEGYHHEALEKRRRVFGDEHPHTLESINHMGSLLQDQGKLTEAEGYYREALEKRRRVLGDDHPDTLVSINNMGILLTDQGELVAAEEYLREALEKRRHVLGEEHPQTLISINCMGGLLKAQGKLAEAEPYDREALEKRRRVLGDEHPDTLRSINNMGDLLQFQGKLSEAEPYFREALETKRRVLGDEHPSTLISINNMGFLLRAQGKLAEAEGYYREALEKRRRVLGDEHPDTLGSINSMGYLLQSQGKLAEAESLLLPAVQAAEQKLPLAHGVRGKLLTRMGKLYDAWHAAEPDMGYDAKAAEWRDKLAEWQASTQPASSQPTSQP